MDRTIERIIANHDKVSSDAIDTAMSCLGDSYDSQITGLARTKDALVADGGTMPQAAILLFAKIGFNVVARVWIEKNKDRLDATEGLAASFEAGS